MDGKVIENLSIEPIKYITDKKRIEKLINQEIKKLDSF
jgi:hypothetical protein